MMSNNLNSSKRIELYKSMLRIRFFEEKIIELYPQQQMKTPVHLCIGQEAIAAGVCFSMHNDDTIFSTHRNHGHCLARGMSYYRLLAEFHGRITGCSGGKGGSMHPVSPEHGILGTTAIVGGNIPLAVGAALTYQMMGKDSLSVAFFGDGASEEGTFHESLNFAVLKSLPVLFVCENNLYATASPISQRQPEGSSITQRAKSFGIEAHQVDGNDLEAVHLLAESCIAKTRQGKGPIFIEAMTYRWKSHVGPTDDTDTGHRPADELSFWQKKCPVLSFRDVSLSEDIWSLTAEQRYLDSLAHEFSQALDQSLKDPFPSEDDLMSNLFTEH